MHRLEYNGFLQLPVSASQQQACVVFLKMLVPAPPFKPVTILTELIKSADNSGGDNYFSINAFVLVSYIWIIGSDEKK